ncbi:MAG: hypothetical protein KAH77_03525 [Thiomargarita sp.]|nr:hypothetical protein [Thiomargarita sp.]
MQEIYQEASNQLEISVENVVAKLRVQLQDKKLNIDTVAQQSMTVEIVAFLLVKCLCNERQAFVQPYDEQEARARAMEIVKAAVIQYRGGNLVPSQNH